MNKSKKCPICKKAIKGRADKKFCSIKCKNIYNYKLRQVTQNATRTIDNILHRNRSILLEILGKRGVQTTVHRSLLDSKRFNFSYLTGFHVNSRNKTVHYVYDFSWIIFSDKKVVIKRLKRG